MTEKSPIKAVKILGEELVVYRDTQGRYGLVGEHCPHRLASLAYGHVDKEGIRCPYHGWKFDSTGKCLEQPAEPPEGTFKDNQTNGIPGGRNSAGCCSPILDPSQSRCCRVGMF